MGKKRKDRNKIPDHFVALTYELLDSKAFKELNGAALKALILFLKKVHTYNPIDRYQSQFTFTYPEAAKRGLAHSSFSRALKELIEIGFIECVSRGGMRFEGNSCSQYRLSKRWEKYGTPEFEKRWPGHSERVHGK